VTLAGAWAWVRHPRLVWLFRQRVERFPGIGRPLGFNDKILWRKIFDHNPLFVTFSDKVACKAWLGALCPELPVATLLWSGERPEAIPDGILRPGVVVKARGGCNLLRFIEAGDTQDREVLNAGLQKLLHWEFGARHGEWAYSRVPTGLLVEERLGDASGSPLIDLIVFTFGKRVELIVATVGEKTPAERVGLFDREGRRIANASLKRALPGQRLPEDFVLPCDPAVLGRWSAEIAGDLDFVRVDFMWADGQLHGCEVTAYPGSGYKRYQEPSLSDALSAAWDLRRSWFLSTPQPGWRGIYARALGRLLDAGPGG
jgi:hypothetical protein